MTDRPRLTELAQSLPSTVPFVGPEAQERQRGRSFAARLGANESGFGPAPSVVRAIADAAAESWKYCDPESFDLKAAIAGRTGVAARNVVVGEGIDGLLGLVVRLFAGPGDTVATSLGAYPTFNYHVAGFGARLVTVPYVEDREDLAALLDLVNREGARLVYLANPDNPMGTWWDGEDVAEFAMALPPTTLLVLDEAYGETAPAGALPPLTLDVPNVIRLRTFSKAYGLAGLRVGYGLADPETVTAFDKVRNHFGLNRLAQVAAVAALSDQTHLAHVVDQVAEGRERLAGIARSHGLSPIPSATNFVTIDCGRDGTYARRVLEELVARDVFVRKPMAPGIDRCIRVSTGPAQEITIFGERLADALAAADR